ncbi:hypothetical protein RB195_005888 [Necator americanus]|uniref:Uncharacterized protein n=1 Tax=Necator americanus TaxID=51031 RepID=A0ABR1BTF1_NECAM
MSDVSNSFSAWETLPEDEPPLCIAVRRPESHPRHYEAVNRCEDLCEDDTTRAVIATMQQQEARKKRMAFGVRDSRRQSRRRKKFESPQQVATGGDNPFSARGAIRRLSLRDRSGLAPARIEAQKEGAEIIRSWSKEDLNSEVNAMPQPLHGSRDSPNKRVLKQSNKPKPMSPDEWLRKLETGGDDDDDGAPRRGGSQRRRPKKGKGPSEMQDLRPNGDASRRDKKPCCCVIC